MKHRRAALLSARAEAMGVALADSVAVALVALLERLAVEPQNLTSVKDLDTAVDRHLADSLTALTIPEIAAATSIVDVGSGAGFPGLVLAAVLPDVAVTVVEAERRKAEWLARAAEAFPNVRIVHDRAENLALAERGAWDAATARALAPLPVTLELCAPLVGEAGAVVVWRGRREPQEESLGDQAAAILGLASARIAEVTPFPGVERHLAVYRRVAPTPERFPRRPGRAAHRPLP